MQYLGHAQTMSVKPAPINCMRLVMTGMQPKLEKMFRRHSHRLDNNGDFHPDTVKRLVDRRPVTILDAVQRWHNPPKVKSPDRREGYDHVGLTDFQRMYMTKYTRGEKTDGT